MSNADSPDDQHTRRLTKDAANRIQVRGATLAVTAGPDAPLTFEVGALGLVIGTSSECDVQLGDRLVSRRHLEIRPQERGVLVRDLGSSNGTDLGGVGVREVVLTRDATLTLGETTLMVKLRADAIDVALSPRTRFGVAMAASPGMRHVFTLLERAAKSDVTVLLEGESGTGKDVLAHSLHEESARRDGPFVVVDCGAIPEQLVESELFGHEKGAFTGADKARAGAFEQAEGGTLFLDEVGELPPSAQPKLLRALESRSFRRVGGSEVVRVSVRVVAATNRKLREAVRRREFREDLFYRLAVVHIGVPRLADRPEDIPVLAEAFLRRTTGDETATLPEDLVRLLASYAWPGNARELRNVVERFATFERTDPSLLFSGDVAQTETRSPFARILHLPYHDAKERVVRAFHAALLPAAVARAGGSVPRAAADLGLPKASLYRMLREIEGAPDDPDAP